MVTFAEVKMAISESAHPKSEKTLADIFKAGTLTSVNCRSENIFHKIAWEGSTQILKSLLSLYKNNDQISTLINARDDAGCTPVHNAVIRNNAEILEVLLSHGAEIDTQDLTGMSPLMDAVFWENVQITRILLPYNPCLDFKDSQNRTILKIAKDRKAKKCQRLLEDYISNKTKSSSVNANFLKPKTCSCVFYPCSCK